MSEEYIKQLGTPFGDHYTETFFNKGYSKGKEDMKKEIIEMLLKEVEQNSIQDDFDHGRLTGLTKGISIIKELENLSKEE